MIFKYTQGCPNLCAYCKEPMLKMEFYDPPKVMGVCKTHIQIWDMNFLANPKHLDILHGLPKRKYEFVCGVDFRRVTLQIAQLMKEKGFIKVRWAWDYGFSQQKKHRDVLKMFLEVGYKPESLSVFVLANWKVPYGDCMRKLDLLKVWNVKVNDCCWDGGYRIAKPVFWLPEHIKKFRAACRKHNQLVNFKIDPEVR